MGRKQEKCKEGCVWGWTTITAAMFEYDTAKIVHIKNKKVGLLNRLVQLAIIGYVIGYGIIYERGYQKTGSVVSSVTTKMKGAYLFNNSDKFMKGCEDYFNLDSWSVYDPADYVIPPQEPNSFFVMTNMWITCGQQYSECHESKSVTTAHCSSSANCTAGMVPEGGNGPFTGVCNQTTGTCMIRAWCPVEEENKNITMSAPRIDASKFTVLIKNSITYPSLRPGERKRNIKSTSDGSFLKSCRFNPHSNNDNYLYCPIMSLGSIIGRIHGENFTEISIAGGVISIGISWTCNNLEYGLHHCDPQYSFRRLDDKHVKISEGFNFRFARYYQENGMETRTLFKAYGILFKVVVTGQGGIFDFFVLVIKLGSMIALLGIAVVVSDVIVLYVLRKGKFYREKKYQNVNDAEIDGGYEVIDNLKDDNMPTEATPVTNHTEPTDRRSQSPRLQSDKL